MKATIQGTIKKKIQDMEQGEVFHDDRGSGRYLMVTDENSVLSLVSGVLYLQESFSSDGSKEYQVYDLGGIELHPTPEKDIEE